MTLSRPWRVLLVEDSPFLRYAARAVLQRRGFEVIEAVDGQEALELVHQSRPDVVLLDLVMPRLSGEEVLRALKNDPALSEIPVLMLGSTEETGSQTAIRNQVEGYFLKANMSLVSLADRVEALLNNQRVA